MTALIEAKREWYRLPDVASTYDAQRFGGTSGEYVNAREIALTLSLLPQSMQVIADIACGTGRLLPGLRQRAQQVIGLDASLAMLSEAGRKSSPGDREPLGLVQADAFQLPLPDASCDCLTSMRLLFHFDDPRPLLREFRRIARPGGRFVCDTSAWSPRTIVPVGRERWGARVATIRSRRFAGLARSCGWQVVERREAFLVSPYVYRRLPLPLAQALERLEHRAPGQMLCRVFWGLKAV